ncbi:hypothetical protein K470DRAFT_254181 [Piedraia hortae CBS 480.64]|uniref:Uncharacterized protein n=1 Tax=Piedraia hortae CBS 480.64 TaxID=1314780 RepID=A0A6A7CAS6_9PEZI|nr:hypothetical protein K470DRAFT_254181 [Piedraia hortae CBS 480.64]
MPSQRSTLAQPARSKKYSFSHTHPERRLPSTATGYPLTSSHGSMLSKPTRLTRAYGAMLTSLVTNPTSLFYLSGQFVQSRRRH